MLGCREFPVKSIELVEEFPLENVSDTLKGDTDLGFMLYHMKFEDGGHRKIMIGINVIFRTRQTHFLQTAYD